MNMQVRVLVVFGMVLLLMSLMVGCDISGTLQETATMKQQPTPGKPQQNPAITSASPPEFKAKQKQTPPASDKQTQANKTDETHKENNKETDKLQTQAITVIEVNPGLNQTTTIENKPADSSQKFTLDTSSTTGTSSNSRTQTNYDINISDLEEQIHNLTNTERMKQGLSLLSLDTKLTIVARKHSEDMARRGFFNHVNPEGLGPMDRYKQAGIIARGCAENIFQCTLSKMDWYRNGVFQYSEYYTMQEIASLVVTSWMSSPGHKKNILDSWATEAIGVGVSADGKIYITQDFK